MNRRERDMLRRERKRKSFRRLRRGKGLIGLLLAVVLCACLVWSCAGQGGGEQKPSPSGTTSAGRRSISLLWGKPEDPKDAKGSQSSSAGGQLSDPLLVLVNGDNALPEGWQVELKSVGGDSGERVDARIYDDLTAMTEAARQDDVWFWVASGFRSVDSQREILDQAVQGRMADGMTEEEAREDALRTIQMPGYSEHHTGLAVDFNEVSDSFEETAAYAWLSQHAAEYGFVQRYRRDKVEYTGIDNESWHYRYVGKENALEMERLDMCLEEYVAYRKEQG